MFLDARHRALPLRTQLFWAAMSIVVPSFTLAVYAGHILRHVKRRSTNSNLFAAEIVLQEIPQCREAWWPRGQAAAVFCAGIGFPRVHCNLPVAVHFARLTACDFRTNFR
jgi:hypothetical protein